MQKSDEREFLEVCEQKYTDQSAYLSAIQLPTDLGYDLYDNISRREQCEIWREYIILFESEQANNVLVYGTEQEREE